jgi:peptidoglycan/xylan/chitin deacetylase (PgdA/CDA1 family)
MSALASAVVGMTAAGLHRARLTKPLSRIAGYLSRVPRFPILSYHRVNDERDPFFPSLPTDVFERHMAFVGDTYVVLPVEELVERMERGRVPRNALAITFDDGYRDNLTHAAPVLARYGLPASVFVATGVIGTGKALWFDRLALAFKLTRLGTYRAPWGSEERLGTTEERLGALGRALRHLKSVPDDERRRGVETVLVDLGVADEGAFKGLMLSWDDVHALTGLGVTIGAHTVSHPILARLDPGKARAEIEGSRDMIAAACGRRPRAFAYPNGKAADFAGTVGQLVREAGFSCAVTTVFGVNTARTSPYALRRGGPWEPELATFALKLAGYRLTQA